jgi:hypothetical protein
VQLPPCLERTRLLEAAVQDYRWGLELAMARFRRRSRGVRRPPERNTLRARLERF